MNNVVAQITDNFIPIDFECSQDFITGVRKFNSDNERFKQWLYSNGLKTDFQFNLGVPQRYIMRGFDIIGQYWENEQEYIATQNCFILN